MPYYTTVVHSQSTDDFLAALRCFVNIRGKPSIIYSDNGTNFEGAANRLAQQADILRKAATETASSIKWVFQPPSSPHFGGAHESLVKSAKQAMLRGLTQAEQRRLFREDELRCLLHEVMGYLNARPLMYVGTDLDDGEILTPNHFLLGRANQDTSLIGVDQDDQTYLRDRYRFMQKVAEDIWIRWQTEYLPTLMARSKWQLERRDLVPGDICLIVEDGLKSTRGKWLTGCVVSTTMSKDGRIRSASLRVLEDSKTGKTHKVYQGSVFRVVTKPVVKLILLLKSKDEEQPKDGDAIKDDVKDLPDGKAILAHGAHQRPGAASQ